MSTAVINDRLSSFSLQEPIHFSRILALFNCESASDILLYRASKRPLGWNNAGELTNLELNCLQLVYPDLELIVRDRRYSPSHRGKRKIGDLIETEEVAATGYITSRKDTRLSILALVASAFPEPWCEIVWEDIETQLWGVVESICLPLLGVLDREDVENFIKGNVNHQKHTFLLVLTRFLIRLRTLLKSRTSPNLLSLISHCCDLFREHVEQENNASRDDLQYLCDSAKIAEISNGTKQPWAEAESLLKFTHNNSKRLNAAIAFALASLSPSWMQSTTHQSLAWKLVSVVAPSTMEIIAQSQLFGIISVAKLPSIRFEALSLETRVLMALCQAKKKEFSDAAEALESLISKIEEVYGIKSLEFLLVGTVLVNCYNATGREASGEKLAVYIWSNVFEPFTLDAVDESMHSTEEIYLVIAMADSFLGQTKYDEARLLLDNVVQHSSFEANLVMSSILRLLKMSRRTTRYSSLLRDWSMLDDAVKIFDKVSEILKYELIEEAICFLSFLKFEDISQVPQLSNIVNILSSYCLNTCEGSPVSRLNLQHCLEALKGFKNKFNLFCVSGPQLAYCRKLRDKFPSASIDIIEQVGSANWRRFKRIKEMLEMEDNTEIEAPATKSVFHDSGLGSSLAFSPSQIELAPRSVASIRSFMTTQDSASTLPAMPLEAKNGKRICCICEKSIKIDNEQQWRRHVFSDLRPYVCIFEDCEDDFMKFASRAEFAIHLGEHQHTKLWTCLHCGHHEARKQLIEDHIELVHRLQENEHSSKVMSEKTVPLDISSHRCPFCNDIPGSIRFVGHICHHLEQISLSAIPLYDASSDEGDGDSTSGDRLSREREASAHASSQVNLTPHIPYVSDDLYQLDEDSCRKRLTTYVAISIRKAAPRNPTEKKTWAKTEYTMESWRQEEIVSQIADLNTGESLTERKQKLKHFQQAQVNNVYDNLKNGEQDPAFEWSLAQINQEYKRVVEKGKTKLETAVITVYARRSLRRNFSAVEFYGLRETMKPGLRKKPAS